MYRKDLDHWLLMERAPHIRSQISWAVAPPLLRILSRFQASLASLAASVKCKFVMLHLPEAGPCHPLDSPRPAVLKFSHSHCHGFSDDQQESRNQEQQVNWGVESLLTDPKYPGQNWKLRPQVPWLHGFPWGTMLYEDCVAVMMKWELQWKHFTLQRK